uniref:Uncharacterized protein n=1 Tax=viral metagenome TaxID=1070528 RepID=A0A6C0H7U2_9ZZZZ
MQSINPQEIINYNEKYLKYKYKYLSLNKLPFSQNISITRPRVPYSAQSKSKPKLIYSLPIHTKPYTPNPLFKPPPRTNTYPSSKSFEPHLSPYLYRPPYNLQRQYIPVESPPMNQIKSLPSHLKNAKPENIFRRGGDLFKILVELHEKKPGYEKILVVPANAGQPWGGIGNKIYMDFYIWLYLYFTKYTSELQKWMEDNLNEQIKSDYDGKWLNLHSNVFEHYKIVGETLQDKYTKWKSDVHNKLYYYSKSPTSIEGIKGIKELIYAYRLFISNEAIKINLINFRGGGLEEDIMRKWISGDKDIFKTIKSVKDGYPEWGLYLYADHSLYNPENIKNQTLQNIKYSLRHTELSPLTIQEINYTNRDNKNKYDKRYKYTATLNINGEYIKVTLLFIFTPNFNNGIEKRQIAYPSLHATVEDPLNNTIEYKKEALSTVFKTIFNSDATEEHDKCYILPRIGGNINKCYLTYNSKNNESINERYLPKENDAFYELVVNTLEPLKKKSEIHVVIDYKDNHTR